VSGQLHTPAALSAGKEPLVPVTIRTHSMFIMAVVTACIDSDGLSPLALLRVVADFIAAFRIILFSFLMLLNTVFRSCEGEIQVYWLT